MAKKQKDKVYRVTLVKSPIGYSQRQKDTVRALGLRRLNQTVEHTDSAAIRGMLNKVSHLVLIEE
jgi:large subunit ribosomal protein L30